MLGFLSIILICGANSLLSGSSIVRSIQATRAPNRNDLVPMSGFLPILMREAQSNPNFREFGVPEACLERCLQRIICFRKFGRLQDACTSHCSYPPSLYFMQRGGHMVTEKLQQPLRIELKGAGKRYEVAMAQRDVALPMDKGGVSQDAETWIRLVRAQFEAGNANGAIQTIDKAVDELPEDKQLIVALAALCSLHDQVQKARLLLEDASELMPGDPAINLQLARISMRAGEPMEALAVLKEMPPNYGTPGEVSLIRGMASAYTGQLEAAATELSAALSANPRNPRYLVASAWVEQLNGRHEKALTVLANAREFDPRAPVIPYRIAASYYFLGKYALTSTECQEAINLDPLYDPGFFLLGIAKSKLNDHLGAQTALRRATALDPTISLYHRELAKALMEAGNLEESRVELDRALSLKPGDPQIYFVQAQVMERQGDRLQAISALKTAVALNANYCDAVNEISRLYTAERDFQKAAAMHCNPEANNQMPPNDMDEHILFQLKNSSTGLRPQQENARVEPNVK